ncbi:hypothetical protein MMA231_00650 [Asticcacaulis sp. MM231]|uniref:hypothetical protein n=1 Tax=Asticcacaulis sp. MM231 TaxID=3157666 RepID=UPI0032D576C8
MPDLKDISDTHQAGAQAPDAGDGTSLAEVAQGHGASDPFAPEGTDETLIKPDHVADEPISDAESVNATQAALGYKAPGTGNATTLAIVSNFIEGFLKGFFRTTPHSTHLRRDKDMRDRLDEDQIELDDR